MVAMRRAAITVGVGILAIVSPTAVAHMEVVGVSSDQQASRQGPEPTLPGPMAPLADEDGNVVRGKDGNPVMIPLTPAEGSVGVLPPGATRRTVENPDGSVSEQVTIASE